jgi:hypothetical protein
VLNKKTSGKSGVYLLLNNVTNKYYVGSGIDLYKRLSRYFQTGYLEYKTQKNLLISRALKKHKMENFTKIIFKKGEDHLRFGIKHSEEVINKMRDNHSKTKIVYPYLSYKKTLIATYDSLRKMTKETGITRDYVFRCIKNNELVHGRWYFCF